MPHRRARWVAVEVAAEHKIAHKARHHIQRHLPRLNVDEVFERGYEQQRILQEGENKGEDEKIFRQTLVRRYPAQQRDNEIEPEEHQQKPQVIVPENGALHRVDDGLQPQAFSAQQHAQNGVHRRPKDEGEHDAADVFRKQLFHRHIAVGVEKQDAGDHAKDRHAKPHEAVIDIEDLPRGGVRGCRAPTAVHAEKVAGKDVQKHHGEDRCDAQKIQKDDALSFFFHSFLRKKGSAGAPFFRLFFQNAQLPYSPIRLPAMAAKSAPAKTAKIMDRPTSTITPISAPLPQLFALSGC